MLKKAACQAMRFSGTACILVWTWSHTSYVLSLPGGKNLMLCMYHCVNFRICMRHGLEITSCMPQALTLSAMWKSALARQWQLQVMHAPRLGSLSAACNLIWTWGHAWGNEIFRWCTHDGACFGLVHVLWCNHVSAATVTVFWSLCTWSQHGVLPGGTEYCKNTTETIVPDVLSNS